MAHKIPNRIFSNELPPNMFRDFLILTAKSPILKNLYNPKRKSEIDTNTIQKCFVFDKECYQKAMLFNHIQTFLETCKTIYAPSAHQFLDMNKITYPRFGTILRQFCKQLGMKYCSSISYDKSKHQIIYYIEYID